MWKPQTVDSWKPGVWNVHRAGVCECGSHGLAERRCGVGWARNVEAGRGERHTVEAFKILNEKKT